jgi:Tetracyclin repressor-like, C-terminal domain
VACVDVLDQETDLERRLQRVLYRKIETSEPFHRFAAQLFKTAADPESPLSPFSSESLPVRREATELMAQVVEGSDAKVSPELAGALPNLLWLYLMSVILFWVHDHSEGCARTYKLIDRTAEIVVRCIKMSALAPMRPLVRGALKLLDELSEISGRPDSTARRGDSK